MISINASAGTLQWVNEIEGFRQLVIKHKTEEFLDAVGTRGIEVATANCHEYGTYISFSKEVKGKMVTVIAKDNQLIPITWLVNDPNGKGMIDKTVEISPLLMTEFGSGQYAVNDFGDPDGGRGTFPGQKHAWQSKWYWVGEDKQLHSSSGQVPERPMYNSFMTLMNEIDSIARSIF